jgi:hypothetical protein
VDWITQLALAQDHRADGGALHDRGRAHTKYTSRRRRTYVLPASPFPSSICDYLLPSTNADARAQRRSASAQDLCAGAFCNLVPAWWTYGLSRAGTAPARMSWAGCGWTWIVASTRWCASVPLHLPRAGADRCVSRQCLVQQRHEDILRRAHTPPADETCTFLLHPVFSLLPLSSPCLSARSRAHPARGRFRARSLRSRAPQPRFCAVDADRRRRIRAECDRSALRRGRRMRDLVAYSGRVDGAPSLALFRETRALMRNAPVLRGDAARTCPGRCMSTNLYEARTRASHICVSTTRMFRRNMRAWL